MARGEKKKIVVKKRFPVTRFAFDEGLEEDFNNRKPEQGVTHGSVKNGGIVYDIDDLLPLEEYLVKDEQIPNTGSIDESMLCWKYINLMSNKPIRDTRLLTSEWEYYPINIHPENNSVYFLHMPSFNGDVKIKSITFKYYNLFTKSIKYEQFYLDLKFTPSSGDTWNGNWISSVFDRGVFPFVKWGISDLDISGVIKNKTVNTNNIGMIFVASDNDIPVNENDGSHQGRSGEHMLGYFPGKDVSKINIKAFPTRNTRYDNDNHVTSKAQLANIFKSSVDDAMKSLNNTLVRGLYNSAKNAYRIKPIFFLKTEKFIKYRVSLPFKVVHNLGGAKKCIQFNPGDDAISEEDTFRASYFNYTTIKPNENNGDDVIVYAPVQKLRDVIEEVTQEDINNGFYLKFFGFSENDIPDSEYKLSYTYSSIDGDLYYEYPDTFDFRKMQTFDLATPDLGYKFYYDISNDVECAHFVIEESISYDPVNVTMEVSRDIKCRESTGEPSSGIPNTGGIALLSIGVGNGQTFNEGHEPFFTESLNEYITSYDSDLYYEQQEKTVNGKYFWKSNLFYMQLEQGSIPFNELGSPSRLFLEVDVDFRGSRKISFNTEIEITSKANGDEIKEKLIFGKGVTEEDLRFIEEGEKPRIRVKWTTIPK